MWINDEGQLVAETELGAVKFTKPVAYQEINGKRVDVGVEYRVESSEVENKSSKHKICNSKLMSTHPKSTIQNLSSTSIGDPKSKIANRKLEYGFKVASYDKTKDLIIDPLLASTFLGGYSSDYGYSMAVDSEGNIYVAGETSSSDFPTSTGTYQSFYKGYNNDAFVSKLNSDLTTLLASTYLGGYDYYDEVIYSIDIDFSNNVYITGMTKSSDFPTTTGAYDTSAVGTYYYDTFVTKLNGDLTILLASTYLGGSQDDRGGTIVTDSSGNIYVAGYTGSSDFPTTTGAYDPSRNSNYWDVYISKLDGNLTSLIASTFLGGDSDSGSYSGGYYNPIDMAIDSNGDIYVAGKTNSTTFPTTASAYDTSYNDGGYDVFVSKLKGDLTSLLASTYLGGANGDYVQSLTIDSSGNIYVAGLTSSSDFPTTTGAYDTSYGSGGDVFVSKLNADLSNLIASTYLGGSDADNAYSIAMDSSGNIYAGGYTWSSTFPTTTGAYDTSYGGYGDIFVSKLNGNLTSLLFSTYLGGASYDYGYSTIIDSYGNIYISGYTGSSDFPTTSDAYQNSYKTHSEVFISKFDSNLSGPPPSGSVSINNDDVYTNSTIVTLNLSATDDVGITGYYISTGSSTASISSSGWTSVTSTTNYNEYVSHTLSSGDGEKTVYVWYKDNSENISDVVSDSIILDQTSPTMTITSPTSDNTYTVTNSIIAIGGTASDGTSGISSVTWNNDKGESGMASGTTSWLTSSISLLSGENSITTTATDGAGNTGTDKITVTYNTGTVSTPTPTPTVEPNKKCIILGYVIDRRSNPIESAKIRLKRANSRVLKKTFSDEDGFFEFTDLDADSYAITALKKGYKTVKQTVTLEAGEEKDVEFVMKKANKKRIIKVIDH